MLPPSGSTLHARFTVQCFHSSTELGSGIVSTALQCGTERCPTDDLELSTPVWIIFDHSKIVKVREQ